MFLLATGKSTENNQARLQRLVKDVEEIFVQGTNHPPDQRGACQPTSPPMPPPTKPGLWIWPRYSLRARR